MILVLDNHDSFVHNLARYFRTLGRPTKVVRSDGISVKTCRDLDPEAIVISPGPHDPAKAGCSVSVIQELGSTIPILGICLGHQAVGVAFGASIVQCEPMHGVASEIRHEQSGLFEGCENPMVVGRYHSLAIAPQSLPKNLRATAWTDDGIVMAVEHRQHRVFGLQFHPESVLTPTGERTLENFIRLAQKPLKT